MFRVDVFTSYRRVENGVTICREIAQNHPKNQNITYFGFLNDFVPFRVENGVTFEEKP